MYPVDQDLARSSLCDVHVYRPQRQEVVDVNVLRLTVAYGPALGLHHALFVVMLRPCEIWGSKDNVVSVREVASKMLKTIRLQTRDRNAYLPAAVSSPMLRTKTFFLDVPEFV